MLLSPFFLSLLSVKMETITAVEIIELVIEDPKIVTIDHFVDFKYEMGDKTDLNDQVHKAISDKTKPLYQAMTDDKFDYIMFKKEQDKNPIVICRTNVGFKALTNSEIKTDLEIKSKSVLYSKIIDMIQDQISHIG